MLNTSAEAPATGGFALCVPPCALEFCFLECHQNGDFKRFHPNFGMR